MKRLLLVLLLLTATLACAQEPGNVYVGVALGQARFNDPCNGAPPRVVCDGSSRARRFFMGYQLSRHFAFEFGLADLGAISSHDTAFAYGTETATLTATEVSALASWPLGERLALVGRLGIYTGDVQNEDSPVPAFGPRPQFRGWQSSAANGITYGLGARYTLLDHVALRVEWQRMPGFGGVERQMFDIDTLTLGVVFSFGTTARGSR